MILQLLLLLAAARASQAEFKECPEDSACLYHARCLNSPKPDDVLATTSRDDYKAWVEKCSDKVTISQVFVRPISNHKWIITLESTNKNAEIRFGGVTVDTSVDFVSFRAGPDDPIKFFLDKNSNNTFTIDYSEEKLLEIFPKSRKVIYKEKDTLDGPKVSDQPLFWETLRKLTPCDDSLIIDCEPEACLEKTKETVGCKTAEESMWFMSPDSKVQKLNKVSCNSTTNEWKLDAEIKATVGSGGIEIRCDVKKPEPWIAKQTESFCDVSLIDCTSEHYNCTGVIKNEESVKCNPELSMWLKTSDSWQNLTDITCNKDKKWSLNYEKGEAINQVGYITIECSVEKPSTCDENAIADGCVNENCTKLTKSAKSVTCKEGNLWLTSTISWQQLTEVTCAKNQWTFKNETDTFPETSGTIQCAVNATTSSTTEPSPTIADSNSSDSETDEDEGEKKPKDDESSANCILHMFLVPLAFYSALI